MVNDSDVRAFRSTFAGALITSDDADYDTARDVWNGDIDKRPMVIARCTTAQDVVDAVRFGVGSGLEISIRGGAHNFGGAAIAEDGLVIDLSRMNQVTVDPDARTAEVGGGATLADLDAATQAHGLAAVGGTVSHTGIAGLTLGGGMGWLTPRHGLSIDNLLGCELVTADGRVLHVSEHEHPDLFWALRGGGGNFGVVTKFEFRLHEVGPMVNVGFFFWGLDDGRDALRFCREFAVAAPGDVGMMLAGLHAPPAPFVPQEHHFKPGYALVVAGFGTPEEHAQATRPILERGAPLFHMITPMPYVELQKMLDDAAPWGIRAYERGLYTDGLTDEVIDVVADHLPRKSSPMSILVIFMVTRGAFAAVPDEATAFGGSRSIGATFTITAEAQTPELLQADRAWVRAFWDALAPHASNVGGYVNFMTEYEEDRVRLTYGPAKYERLARIKADYDPDNVFHLNANIKPALQPA